MFIINTLVTESYLVKGSKFICYLEPIYENNPSIRQNELKQEHFKAVHVVYALRVLNEFNQIVENQSDDKEPKGTSGQSTLNALRGANLINCACYIVRYFGGTLLGSGGLVRAYSTSVNQAIIKAQNENLLQSYIKRQNYSLYTNYNLFNKISYILDKNNIIYDKEFSDLIKVKMSLSDEEMIILSNELKDMQIQIIKD